MESKIVKQNNDGSVVVKINKEINIVVAKYEEEFPERPISKESGWWIVRSYNQKTLNWVDHSRPGYGVTWWVTTQMAEQLGLN